MTSPSSYGSWATKTIRSLNQVAVGDPRSYFSDDDEDEEPVVRSPRNEDEEEKCFVRRSKECLRNLRIPFLDDSEDEESVFEDDSDNDSASDDDSGIDVDEIPLLDNSKDEESMSEDDGDSDDDDDSDSGDDDIAKACHALRRRVKAQSRRRSRAQSRLDLDADSLYARTSEVRTAVGIPLTRPQTPPSLLMLTKRQFPILHIPQTSPLSLGLRAIECSVRSARRTRVDSWDSEESLAQDEDTVSCTHALPSEACDTEGMSLMGIHPLRMHPPDCLIPLTKKNEPSLQTTQGPPSEACDAEEISLMSSHSLRRHPHDRLAPLTKNNEPSPQTPQGSPMSPGLNTVKRPNRKARVNYAQTNPWAFEQFSAQERASSSHGSHNARVNPRTRSHFHAPEVIVREQRPSSPFSSLRTFFEQLKGKSV